MSQSTFLFACSLRIGEIVGLTWDNIHISDADIAGDNAYLCVEKRTGACA